MARNRRSRGSSLKREMGWAAYNFANEGSGFLVAPTSVTTYVDWLKYPGGVFNSQTDAPEPINDTLAKILMWGGISMESTGTSTVGRVEHYLGIIEWHGVSQAPPPDDSYPFPGGEANAEWVWWLKLGGYASIPSGGPVVNTTVDISDWQRMSSAKRKLPENVGLLLVYDVVNDTDQEIAVHPSIFWRFLLHQGEILRSAR